ncbi:MAG: calcium/proton exchanger [Anaerolineae bacterium]|nr:calcium/proton exchanger [Anaerolineae bacterium]
MIRYLLYAMLLFVPITLVAEFILHAEPIVVFITSALAIIPLADFIGEATEELALRIGPRWGGLLNATLGNAAELIITVFAIREGLLELVRASITGSILGNLLLILGLSFFLGGLKNGTQSFDRRTAMTNATLVFISVIALLIPSLFDIAIQDNLAAELGLSEGIAITMIVLYGLSILYGFMQGRAPGDHDPQPEHIGAADKRGSAAHSEHEPQWSVAFAVGVLAVATIGIVFMSEALVGAVESVTEAFGLTEIFIGIIVIPLVGNVAEHLVSVQVALKDKMELRLAVSLGSSLQIALFVAPVLVFISLLIDSGNPLLLVFNRFELIALIAAAVIASNVARDGESNWFEGVMLLSVYIMIGVGFFFIPAGV